MPYLVNGQPVAEELILEELVRLGRDFQWQAIPDPTERDHRLRRIKAREKVELTGFAAGTAVGVGFSHWVNHAITEGLSNSFEWITLSWKSFLTFGFQCTPDVESTITYPQ
jgi:hypothetical protein